MQMQIEEFTVRDRLGPVVFKGQILADCRFAQSDKPRWTDMVLYGISDPASTRRSAQVIEQELIRDLSRLDPLREMPRGRRTDFLNSLMPHIVPRLVDEQPVYQYVLSFIARSAMYHLASSDCVRDRHRISTAAQVRAENPEWRGMWPCRRCRPDDLHRLSPGVRIAEEKDKHHLYLCTDASDVLSRLYRRNGEISELAVELLTKAAATDPAIARAFSSTRRV